MIKHRFYRHLIVIIILSSSSFHFAFSQELKERTKSVRLGDQTVYLKIFEKPGKDIVFAHVHENEVAALEAGKQILAKHGGRLVTLMHSSDGTKNRNVTFTHAKTTYQFDPNRIYSVDDKVLFKTIRIIKGNGKVDQNVIDIIKNLATQIWGEMHDLPYIVAIHNNKNTPAEVKTKWLFLHRLEPESYSVNSYIKSFDQSGESNKSCSDIYINPMVNNSEFFIVTERNDFKMLSEKRYTVVLQNDNPVDDGSMSVYAYRKGKRYVNAEAKMGRVKEQIEMLEILLK